MKVIEKSAKTVDAAVELALQELSAAGLTRQDVEVEVIEPGSKGILGMFGGKDAVVRVSYNDKNPGRDAINFLQPIFKALRVTPNHTIENREDMVWITFQGKGLGAIIGRRGETLDALQYLTNLAVNRQFEEKSRIVLDVEGYRAEREKTLTSLAHKMADKVRRTDRDVILEPMSPHERRVIHIALQEEEGVKTVSVGEEPYRKIIIKRLRDKI